MKTLPLLRIEELQKKFGFELEDLIVYGIVTGKLHPNPLAKIDASFAINRYVEKLCHPRALVSQSINADLRLKRDDLSFDGLLFENEETLKSQIFSALSAGKHIMLLGPSGNWKNRNRLRHMRNCYE